MVGGTAAAPLAMIVLRHGPGGIRHPRGWQISTAITAVKLLVQPLLVWLLARLLGLPPLETRWWCLARLSLAVRQRVSDGAPVQVLGPGGGQPAPILMLSALHPRR